LPPGSKNGGKGLPPYSKYSCHSNGLKQRRLAKGSKNEHLTGWMDKRPASPTKRYHSERWTGSSSGFIPGQDLHDHLELKELLGHVGYCEVWHAHDQKGRRDVILKVLPSALTAEVAMDAKAQAEIRHAQALDHPHILKCYQVLHDNTWTAVEMEDLMAHPLASLLEKESSGHFEVGKIRVWTGQLLEALIHAHEEIGVVHGDLKLSNLAVNEEGGLKVSDFILDHILSQWADKRGYMPEPPGSEGFWSPQILAGQKVSNADDIYAVGACLYHLLAGKPPFSGKDIFRQIETVVPDPPSQKRRQPGKTIPASWEKAIASCLDKDPAKRPPSIRKLAEQLGYTPPKSRRRKAGGGGGARLPKNLLLYGAGVLLFVLMAGGVTVWYQKVHLPAEQARLEKLAREQEEARIQAEEAEKRKKEEALIREKEQEQARLLKEQEEAARLREQEANALKAQARGSLRMTTEPPGAKIFIEGLESQVTPAHYAAVPLGRKKARLELSGYEPAEIEVEIREGEESAPGKVLLVRQKGSVHVQSRPAGARVYADGKPIGTTPLLLKDYPTGPVSYQLRLQGYESQEINGVVHPGRECLLSTVLNKKVGPPAGGDFTNTAGMTMVWVAPLGCWVSREETTQEQFFKIMRSNPSQFRAAQRPVERVTWREAREFCLRLTAEESQIGRLGPGVRYRLPTDAEWGIFAGDARLTDAVTGMDPEVASTREVRSKGPNQFGLYDVRGNVWEWCEDIYQNNKEMRILRGGSWLNKHADTLALENRDYSGINDRGNNRGFRSILTYDDQ
jgi:hypothetical protein